MLHLPKRFDTWALIDSDFPRHQVVVPLYEIWVHQHDQVHYQFEIQRQRDEQTRGEGENAANVDNQFFGKEYLIIEEIEDLFYKLMLLVRCRELQLKKHYERHQ